MQRRIVPLAHSFGLALTLGLLPMNGAFAQEVKAKEKVEAPKQEAPKKEEAKAEPAKKEEGVKKEPEKVVETPPPTVPPEVEAKLEAARHAIAEAIVAAQDAGLVESSIDPPPILDIIIKGYAIDARALKNTASKKPYAVSPEVFGAWFTSYGKLESINPQNDIRILNPSAGLKQWYDQRASILNRHIEMVRKAKGPAPKAAEPKTEAVKKVEEVKKEEPKKDEVKKVEEVKKEEPKKK